MRAEGIARHRQVRGVRNNLGTRLPIRQKGKAQTAMTTDRTPAHPPLATDSAAWRQIVGSAAKRPRQLKRPWARP
eukprot:2353565-Alexandrium_andersonii.AAC.1